MNDVEKGHRFWHVRLDCWHAESLTPGCKQTRIIRYFIVEAASSSEAFAKAYPHAEDTSGFGLLRSIEKRNAHTIKLPYEIKD